MANAHNTFLTITDEDHGGYIWIAVLLSFCFTTTTTLARLSVKWKFLGAEDWAIIAAQVISWGSTIAAVVALTNGQGKALDIVSREDQRRQADASLAMQILILAALSASKCSVALLIQRVFTQDFRRCGPITTGIYGFSIIWGIASMITISARCSPEHIFEAPSSLCPSEGLRWKLIVGLDAAIELALIISPAAFLSLVQIGWKHKMLVEAAFLFRLPLIPIAIVYAVMHQRALNKNMAGTSLVPAIYWQQIELCYSLISASIPCMRAFLRSFSKSGSAPYFGSWANHDQSTDLSFTLPSLGRAATTTTSTSTSRRKVEKTIETEQQDELKLRPENMDHTTVIYHSRSTPQTPKSERSVGSQDITVRKDTHWEFHYV